MVHGEYPFGSTNNQDTLLEIKKCCLPDFDYELCIKKFYGGFYYRGKKEEIEDLKHKKEIGEIVVDLENYTSGSHNLSTSTEKP